MTKTLTPKERVLMTFAHQEPDRVPVDYLCNPGIDQRLKEHYRLKLNDDEGLLQALGVDFRYVWAPYIGPRLHPEVEGRTVDEWGIHRRWVEHDTGGYWDYTDFPLKDATLEMIENWPMPSPDDFDYSHISAYCQKMKDYCIVAGNAGVGDIINSTGMLRTMEQVLVDLMTSEPACLRYLDRKAEVMQEVSRRILEASRDSTGKLGVDIFHMGEDLGTQIGPMVSLKLFRKHLRPRLQEYANVGLGYGLPVMLHSCGSSSWAFEDFMEMGIFIVDTLQPEATNMAPAYLKSRFGDRLAFHGCISTGGPVAYGSVEETIANVRETLEIMMPGGGYALSPSHQLQDNSPTENVVAMYEAARTYGCY
jgi:uroporphyrinogen decarboxylase